MFLGGYHQNITLKGNCQVIRHHKKHRPSCHSGPSLDAISISSDELQNETRQHPTWTCIGWFEGANFNRATGAQFFEKIFVRCKMLQLFKKSTWNVGDVFACGRYPSKNKVNLSRTLDYGRIMHNPMTPSPFVRLTSHQVMWHGRLTREIFGFSRQLNNECLKIDWEPWEIQ